ncbi:MAG TPA: hypothetical protein VFW11_23755 [Cyclobacteriaceae bacterium]|nr:hypothetical protein [Cyclobacteriaceae bacterium]
MKKLFYILLLSLASSIAFTACTDEDVKPAKPISGGGGSTDPM